MSKVKCFNISLLTIIWFFSILSNTEGLEEIGNPFTATTQCGTEYDDIEARMPTLVKLYCAKPGSTVFTEYTTTSNISTIIDLNVRIGFFIHGFSNGQNVDATIYNVPKAFASNQYNGCLLDWRSLSSPPYDYFKACKYNILLVAEYFANLVANMNSKGVDIEEITIAGHSLGAHIAGESALRIKTKTQKQVKAVHALDPNQPGTGRTYPYTIIEALRVEPFPAGYVMCYYTSAPVTASIQCACANSVINYVVQPACLTIPVIADYLSNAENIGAYVGCSHVWVLGIFMYILDTNNNCTAKYGSDEIRLSDTTIPNTCPRKTYCLATKNVPDFCPATELQANVQELACYVKLPLP